MDRLRRDLETLRQQKRVSFHDLDRLIGKIVKTYESLFPLYETNCKGSRVVYHFNVAGIFPLVLEREHKGRDCVLPKFAKLALNHIEDVLVYVESRL